MDGQFEDPTKYRIVGIAPTTEDHPGITFQTPMYFAFDSQCLEQVKEDAEQLRTFFGLKDWEVQIETSTDKWERVKIDG